MSDIAYAGDVSARPELGLLGSDERRHADRSAPRALQLAYLPALICVTVHALFLVAYWVPELAGFPGHRALLTELAPLVSKELTSDSHPVVATQADHAGVAGGYLLIAGLAIPLLARARYWVARLGLWLLSYVGGVFATVVILGLVVRGQFVDGLFGVALLIAWMVGAAVTSWRSLWVDVRTMPPKPRGLWLLATYALINPIPVAVGRRLFAPELRVSATEVMVGGFALEWTALITPATFPVFLSGLSVGLIAWAGYALLPPMVVRRKAAVTALALGILLTALTGAWASSSSAARAEQLRMGSPADDLGFGCGSSIERRPGRPAVTLAASGASCTKLTAYSGYRRIAERSVSLSVSPVAMHTPEGQVVSTPFVSAPYGSLAVVAATNRFDNRATTVWGVRYADAASVWTFRCPDGGPIRLRFAGSTAGESLLAGRLTREGEPPTIFVACANARYRLDPRTGRAR